MQCFLAKQDKYKKYIYGLNIGTAEATQMSQLQDGLSLKRREKDGIMLILFISDTFDSIWFTIWYWAQNRVKKKNPFLDQYSSHFTNEYLHLKPTYVHKAKKEWSKNLKKCYWINMLKGMETIPERIFTSLYLRRILAWVSSMRSGLVGLTKQEQNSDPSSGFQWS